MDEAVSYRRRTGHIVGSAITKLFWVRLRFQLSLAWAGWFRSRLVGQIAAAMMAVSPYGIYLAQEARHYTLAILLIIASRVAW